MIKKFFKARLSIVLAFSLVMMPNSFAYSKTITDLPQSQTVIGVTTSDSLTGTAAEYGDVKKLAEKKATLLTSIYGVTSIQYAFIDNGEIVLSGQAGVYSKDTDTALTDNNMYGIGSISKIFTTVAVMQLVEQGKVNLDTPVINYIPEFVMEDSRYKDITVRMLLNHSSGLMGSTLINSMLFNDNDFSTYKNLLNTLKTSRLKAAPGEFSVYCNDGFTLAEIVVEKVTGISFSKYIKINISDPLGLDNTKTPLDKFQKNILVKTYIAGIKNTLPTESLNMIGAGGIYSSAKNLCHFAEIFMNRSSSKVLANTSVKTMENPEYLTDLWPQEEDSIISYGLGWDSIHTYPFEQYGIKALSKGGDTALFHGNLIVLPEENMAVAVLSSGGASTYNQIMAQEILLTALKSKGSIDEIKANKIFANPIKASMPSTQKQYEGTYAYSTGVVKVAISEDGILTLSNPLEPNTGSQKYIYTGDGRFYYTDGSAYLSFVEKSNENTYLYSAGYTLLPSLGQFANAGYQAQKLKENPITPEIKAVWEKRTGKKYFLINEKYSSQLYAFNSQSMSISLLNDLEGYCMNATIIDNHTARTLLQIPGINGRDLADFNFYNLGDAEYLNTGGRICISEDAIKSLSTKSTFTCKINAAGYAHWYKISEKSKNRKIKVTLPNNSSFSVYDANNNCVNYSYISNQDTVTLPLDGYIAFVGSANTKFTVKYVK